MMNRTEAWQLLCEWTEKEGLRKHALGVEAAMRAFARRMGEDEETWGLVGLLHDFDYERYPDAGNHPFRGAEHLRSIGFPEELVRAILAHASYTGVPRDTDLARVLFAVDELVGLITAAALVTPDRKVASVGVPSVLKKMKDKAFARSVNREEIREGATALGLPLEEHIGHVLQALQEAAPSLGL